MVYLASTLALAALEYLVHVDIEDVPDDLVAIRVYIPDDILPEEVDVADLDEAWNATPDAPGCIQVGDEWVRRGDSLLLKVPSAVVPEESNYLMNPSHADAGRVEIRSTRPFTFDPRLSG